MISVLTFGGFIIRNLDEIMKDEIKLTFWVLDMFFYAGLLTVFNSDKDIFLGIIYQSLLYLIVIMTWIGMRSITWYLYIIYCILSFIRIPLVNQAMGIDGAAYIFSAFWSLMIQMYLNILPRVKNENIHKDFFGEKKKEIFIW